MTNRNPLRIAVLISGGGSNLQAILDRFHQDDGCSLARVMLVISDRESALGLERAEKAGVETMVMSPAEFTGSEAFGEKLIESLEKYEIDYVVLAGYLKMIPPNVIRNCRNRIINIHPALLPLFGGKGMYGKRVHQAVLKSGMKISGATIHFVDEEYDRGPIIAQQAVPVHSDDTPESLAARVLAVEHVLLPRAIGLIAEGKVSVRDGIVDVDRAQTREPGNNS